MTIHCSVNNCHYWTQGNVCEANEIMVTTDEIGKQYPDTMDAPQAQQFSATPADSCMQTCCKTFVRDGSGDEPKDGVYKKKS